MDRYNDIDRIYSSIESLRKEMHQMNADNKVQSEIITKLRIEVGGLKIKSTLWGAFAGAVPVIAFYFIEMFRK